ncbi:MAG: hypothetical protein ABII21_01835 [bacterium]
MKDHKDTPPKPESNTFFEKLEQTNPTQVASSLAAQITLKVKQLKKKDESQYPNIMLSHRGGCSEHFESRSDPRNVSRQITTSLGYHLVTCPQCFA